MMMSAVLALALIMQQQVVAPLAITIETDKETYISGETVRVTVRLENRSDKPIVIARVMWDGAVAAGCLPVLTRGGQHVETDKGSTCPSVQVMVSLRVTEDRFITLAPGKRVAVYREWYSEERNFHGHDPSLKASYQYMTTATLSPGQYFIEAKYQFSRDKPGWVLRDGNWEFQSERAKKLFYSAWTGELTASATFRVLPRPE